MLTFFIVDSRKMQPYPIKLSVRQTPEKITIILHKFDPVLYAQNSQIFKFKIILFAAVFLKMLKSAYTGKGGNIV